VVLVAARSSDLRQGVEDGQVTALRLLVDRHQELAAHRVQTVTRLHRLLLELIPGGAPRFLSALQAKALLASVRPRDVAGRTRRQMAAELLADLVSVDRQLKGSQKRLREAVTATDSTLMGLHGLGLVGAARLIADVADIDRFPTKARFASWTGTAPIDASSGEQIRHRLSRAGNRRLNRVLHIMAIVQLRHDTEGRAYYRRKLAAGKTPMEALRCLKRRLSDVVYRQMVADAHPADDNAPEATLDLNDDDQTNSEQQAAGPGGHAGATTDSSAAGSNPNTDTSEKSLPGPATDDATPTPRRRRIPVLT